MSDPDGHGPNPEQEATVRHLIADDDAVRADVLHAWYDSYRERFDDEWARSFDDLPACGSAEELTTIGHLRQFTIGRQAVHGFAPVHIECDVDWADAEHGLGFVYLPDRGVYWGQFEDLEWLCRDEVDLTGYPLPDWFPLLAAVWRGDEAEVERLVTAGLDINAPARWDEPKQTAPLSYAVDRMDPAMVTRLLGLGADPRRPSWNRSTPREEAIERQTVPSRRPTGCEFPVDPVARLLPKIPPLEYHTLIERTAEVIRLLEAAESPSTKAFGGQRQEK